MNTNRLDSMQVNWHSGAPGSFALIICVNLRDLTPEDFGAAVEVPFIRVHSRLIFVFSVSLW